MPRLPARVGCLAYRRGRRLAAPQGICAADACRRLRRRDRLRCRRADGARRHGHVPVHGPRGVDAPLGGAPGRDARRRWRATTRSCATRSTRTTATSSRRRATASTLRSRPRRTRVRRRARRTGALGRRDWGETGRCACAWACTPARPKLRDGDYFGTDGQPGRAHDGAAHGGQVVVSLATEELVRTTARPEASSCVDLGEHRLRDLARRRARVPGRARRSRPRVPAAALARRVPRQPAVAAHVVRRARTTSSRCVDSARRGAARDPHRRRRRRQDRGSRSQIAAEVAAAVPRRRVVLRARRRRTTTNRSCRSSPRALGREPAPGRLARGRASSSSCGPKRLLVVLDNCEHLLDDAGAARGRRSSASCPGVRDPRHEPRRARRRRRADLAAAFAPVPESTRRRPSAIVGERRGPPLRRPRARRATPTSCSTPATPTAVAEICRRLDGIPLAIELAAARVVADDPARSPRCLDERFRLLTGGRRSGVERHQTLRADRRLVLLAARHAERTVVRSARCVRRQLRRAAADRDRRR